VESSSFARNILKWPIDWKQILASQGQCYFTLLIPASYTQWMYRTWHGTQLQTAQYSTVHWHSVLTCLLDILTHCLCVTDSTVSRQWPFPVPFSNLSYDVVTETFAVAMKRTAHQQSLLCTSVYDTHCRPSGMLHCSVVYFYKPDYLITRLWKPENSHRR